MKSKKLSIAVAFDGTCVADARPFTGNDIGSVSVLKQLVSNEHKLILYTTRSAGYLDRAVDWFIKYDIELSNVNCNPSQRIWTDSQKIDADIYIDSKALGTPLTFDEEKSDKPFVDWKEIKKILLHRGLI